MSYTRSLDLSGTLEGAGGIGGLLARTAHTGANGVTLTHAFYHADGNGNITHLINPDRTLGASYVYDPDGRTLSSSGTLAAANTYRFSSKDWMAASGLYYYGYRFYDPMVQRWPNRDPLGELGRDGPNIYAFVRNCPTDRVDRDGMESWGAPFFPPPRTPDREGCVTRCIQANGGGWALAAFGVSTVGGGTVLKPYGARALGAGCCTTVPSLIQHFTGLGLRELGRKLNPVANAAQCAAASYLIGAPLSCNAQCGDDINAY